MILIRLGVCASSLVAPLFTRESTKRSGVIDCQPVGPLVGAAVGGGPTASAAAGSTVKLHVTARAEVVTVTVYTPGLSLERGITTTALSPFRMLCAVPLVFCELSTHVSTGPAGPVIEAVGFPENPSGIIAITGRPAPVSPHPHIVTGLGDSAMKFVRLVTVPLPGNRIGFVRPCGCPRPLRTLRVAPLCHLAVFGFSHWPKPTRCRFGRRMPIAWNGPVIHSSMNDRFDTPIALFTATLLALPAASPDAVYPGAPGTSSWVMSLSSM